MNDEVSQKRFSDFSETSVIISSEKKNPNLAVKQKTFLSGIIPTSTFKIGGFVVNDEWMMNKWMNDEVKQKTFSDFAKTMLIVSSKIQIFPLAIKR